MAKAVEGGEKVSGVAIREVPHWLLECDAWCSEQPLLQCMRQIINDFDSLGVNNDKLSCIIQLLTVHRPYKMSLRISLPGFLTL